jgi:hypothetical protein
MIRVRHHPPMPVQRKHISQVELGLTYKFSTGPGGFLFW